MKLVIFLLLTITYTSLGFDENGDFEYFFSLDYLETPLRLAIPSLRQCFSSAKGMYKSAADTFARTLKEEVTDTMNMVSKSKPEFRKILKPVVEDLKNLSQAIREYLPQIEDHIKDKKKYNTLSTYIEKFRLRTETLKKSYNATLIQLKAKSPNDAKIIEDIMQTSYKEALKIFQDSALTFASCMNIEQCKKLKKTS